MVNWDARAVTESAIFHAVGVLASLPYDHDRQGGLPMRQDSFDFLTHKLLRHGGLGHYDSEFADARLDPSGCLRLTFGGGERTLTITVVCEGVVAYQKLFGDGETIIDGVVRFGRRVDPTPAEFCGVLAWLDGDSN